MFSNIGTFQAPSSKFNNTSGNQYNTTGGPPSSVLGPADPHWQSSSPVGRDVRPVTRKAAMFSDIDNIDADDSIFNDNATNQYNYSPSELYAPVPSQPYVSALVVPQPASAPPALGQTTELTPTMAEARMFGGITHFSARNSEFNNTMGVQVNLNYAKGRSAASVVSATSFSNPPSPILANHQPAPPPEQPPKIFHPFPSKPNPTIPHSSIPPNHTVDMALGITDYVLSTLTTAGRFTNVPFLSEAAAAVLSILQGVQGAKDNQGGFARLAAHGCNLISSVVLVYEQRQREGREMAPELVQSLGELVEKLRPIEKFVREQQKRHGFRGNIKRVILYKNEASQVQEYREHLTQALAEFGLRSNINIQDGVAQIDKRLEELVAAMQSVGLQHTSPPASRLPSAPATPSAPTGPPLLLASAGSSSAPIRPTFASAGPTSAPARPASVPAVPPAIAISAPASPLSFTSHMSPLVHPSWAPGAVVNNVGGNQINNDQHHIVSMTGGTHIDNAR